MRKSLLVATREYLENIRTKGFWFGIMIVPFLYALMFLVPTLLEKSKGIKTYAVIDHSGWLVESFEIRLHTEELTTVFENLARDYAQDPPKRSWPEPLRGLGPHLVRLEPETRKALATHVVYPDAPLPENLELPVLEWLDASIGSLLPWWTDPRSDLGIAAENTSRDRFARIVLENADSNTLNRMLVDETIFAYFVIESDPVSGKQEHKYISRNLTDKDLFNWFVSGISQEVRAQRLEREQIDADLVHWIESPLSFKARKISESGEEKQVETRDKVRQWAPALFVYLLWLSIFYVTQMMLSSTIEEKSNRLIEVLLSSITPIQLMVGKILGIAFTGMTVIGSWILTVFLGSKLIPGLLDQRLDFDPASVVADPLYLGTFFVYYILGYLFYAALLVGIGSVCNSVKEAQPLYAPIMVVLFIPLMIMMPIAKDPNSLLAKILSYFPPLTPFVMMNRAAGPPTFWEYAMTILLMIVSVTVCLWAAAKVFRIGILLTGKPPKLREIFRWIRVPVGKAPDTRSSIEQH